MRQVTEAGDPAAILLLLYTHTALPSGHKDCCLEGIRSPSLAIASVPATIDAFTNAGNMHLATVAAHARVHTRQGPLLAAACADSRHVMIELELPDRRVIVATRL
jgi:hypothetical protein